MKFLKNLLFFCLGGVGYVFLEFLWRGRSHGSMFAAGGICFVLLGQLKTLLPKTAALFRGILGAGIITFVELITGLLFNRNYLIWDYRDLPFNFMGQVCLPFTLLWIPLSIAAQFLYTLLDGRLKKRPSV